MNRIKAIFKLLMPMNRVVLQRIESEYVILITPLEQHEGLSPLINDKDRLLRFINNSQKSKILTQQCELTFKTLNTSVDYIDHKDSNKAFTTDNERQ